MANNFARLKHAWNAFTNSGSIDPLESSSSFLDIGSGSSFRPDRVRMMVTNERSIISSIYTRLSIDVGSMDIRHVRLDDNDRFESVIKSNFNNCLSLEPNLDQNALHFMLDVASTLFDKGVLAIVPVETSLNPNISGGYDIQNMRVGHIVQWFPRHVRVDLYNEKTGRREQILLEKKFVAIVENPFYTVMNEPSSTLQRLIRKLHLLDAVDEQSGSGKLDIIIQMPYAIKNETKRLQAETRREDLEFQLRGSKYGIAYADATEKITQLNRPAENNLLKQVEYLHDLLFSELGLTKEILNGTASPEAMLNYYNRTIEPIVDVIVLEMRRKFLTKTARSQGQSVEYFRDPFKLVPIDQIAEIADKFTRNEILTSNEIRSAIGYRPSKDAKADQLINSNMPQADVAAAAPVDGATAPATTADAESIVNDSLDEIDKALDDAFAGLGGVG